MSIVKTIVSNVLGNSTASQLAGTALSLANPVTAAQTVVTMLPSLFSSGGVSPSFFAQFPFMAFLDNSTGHWKSRLSNLRSRTANERLSWYIALINDSNDFHDAVQYSEMFGRRAEHIDDSSSVDYDLAFAFNSIVKAKFFANSNTAQDGPFTRDTTYVLCDLNKAKKTEASKYGKYKMDDYGNITVVDSIASSEQQTYYNDSSDGTQNENNNAGNSSSNNSGLTAQQIAALIAATAGNNNSNSQQKEDKPDYTWLYISLAVVAIAVIAFFAFKKK